MRRFKNEAQAAAALHHTNIVPVYGVGCERGIHFYAMQFIEGRSLAEVVRGLRQLEGIDEATVDLDDAALSPADSQDVDVTALFQSVPPSGSTAEMAAADVDTRRVALSSQASAKSIDYFRSIAELGMQVADALEHAHEECVVHRDIKPSNLILDARGKVWVTDFGLARVEGDGGLTMTGDLVGTLRYMSPEQALAKRVVVDHRTDIYSLGATLYELLTLRPVFEGSDRQELLRQIAFEEPRSPRRVNKSIPAELETILLKSMAKNPADRYASARELSDDLECFLLDKPIKARRPSWQQRATKWARRHKPIVVSAAVSAVLLALLTVAGLAISNLLISWEKNEKDVALKEKRLALQKAEANYLASQKNYRRARDAVDQMLTRVAAMQLLHVPHMEQIRREILEDALGFYQQFLQERSGDPEVLQETLYAYSRVGEIQLKLGRHDHAEQALREMIALTLQAADPDQSHYRWQRATGYHNLGMVLFTTGRLQQAREAYGHSIELLGTLAKQHPGIASHRVGLAGSFNNLSNVLERLGDRPAAKDHVVKALEHYVRLVEQAPDNANYRDLASTAHCNLAGKLAARGEHAEAKLHYQQAMQMQQLLLASHPTTPSYRQGLARSHNGLGGVFKHYRAWDQAVEHFQQAIALQTKLVAEFGTIPEFREELARTHNNLAALWKKRNSSAEARTHFQQALELRTQLVADFPLVPRYRIALARTHNRLGKLLMMRRDDRDAAGEHFRTALELCAKLSDESPDTRSYRKELAAARFNNGRWLHAQGQFADAAEHYRKAAEEQQQLMSESAGKSEQYALADTHLNWGTLLRQTERYEEAEKQYRQAHELWTVLANQHTDQGQHQWKLAETLHVQAALFSHKDRLEEALQAFQEAIRLQDELLADYPLVPAYQLSLARTRTNWASTSGERSNSVRRSGSCCAPCRFSS